MDSQLKPNIYIIVPVFKRASIFEMVYQRLNAIKKISAFKISLVIVGDNEDVCKQVYDRNKTQTDSYVVYQNQPVSNKFNAGFKFLKDKEFDYALICGSDDLISNHGWLQLEKEMLKYEYHYINILDINFYDTKTKRSGYYKTGNKTLNKSIGCFRAIHRNLLESLNWQPYEPGYDSGIDYTMERKISYLKGITSKSIELGNFGHMVDVKSVVNINSFDKLKSIFSFADTGNFPKEIKELLCQQ